MIDPEKGDQILIPGNRLVIYESFAERISKEKWLGFILIDGKGREAIEKMIATNSDCSLIKLNMPVRNGYGEAGNITQEKAQVNVVIVSMRMDTSGLTKLLPTGAENLVLSDLDEKELAAAIGAIIRNEITKTGEPDTQAFTPVIQNVFHEAAILTPREKEIIRHLAGRWNITRIAKKLFLTNHTVEAHRKNIMAKLELKNSAELTKYAKENGLTRLSTPKGVETKYT